MSFTPRLSAPSLTDPWWIHTSKGGKNSCILVNGNSVLPNCFSGDTEILTAEGAIAFEDLRDGQTVRVLTIEGTWRPAMVTHYGRRSLMSLIIGNNMYRATSDHRWVVYERDYKTWSFVETADLKLGMLMKEYVVDDIGGIKSHRFVEVELVEDSQEVELTYCVTEPITHTFTLSSGLIVGNCTGYAWGRFGEIMGSTPKLSRNAARRWFKVDDGDGYQRGQTPQLGAVLCLWSDSFGHVAIVEKVNPDGSILTSESGYPSAKEGTDAWNSQLKSKRFWTSTRTPPSYLTKGEQKSYTFQGFIYNPATGASTTETPRIPVDPSSSETNPDVKETKNNYSQATTSTTNAASLLPSGYIPSDSSEKKNYDYTPSQVFNPNSREHSEALHAGRIVSDAPKTQKFLEYAERQLNRNSAKTNQLTSTTSNQAWSAAFITGVARATGTTSVIPATTSNSNMIRTGLAKGMGTWLSTTDSTSDNQPKAGDIVFFRTNSVVSGDPYQSDYCGIVTEVSSDKIVVIQGNVAGQVKRKEYSTDNSTIVGYYRPDWSKIDVNYEASTAYRNKMNLYSTQVNANDALVREIGYLDNSYQPSISSSDMKLGLINYTSLVSEQSSSASSSTPIQDVVVPEAQSPDIPSNSSQEVVSAETTQSVPSTTLSGCSSSETVVFAYLLQKGLNAAVACGICAAIKHESNFKTGDIGDKGTSFGICQWHKGRGTAMKNMAGENWANNLSGQLDYLWHELTGSYKFVLNALSECPNTLEGAKKAADIFVRKFEVPQDADGGSAKCQATAAKYWSKVFVQL